MLMALWKDEEIRRVRIDGRDCSVCGELRQGLLRLKVGALSSQSEVAQTCPAKGVMTRRVLISGQALFVFCAPRPVSQ